MCVCVRVRACVHACVRACVRVCLRGPHVHRVQPPKACCKSICNIRVLTMKQCSKMAKHAAGEQLDWHCRSSAAPEQGPGAVARAPDHAPGRSLHCTLERPCLHQKGSHIASHCLYCANKCASVRRLVSQVHDICLCNGQDLLQWAKLV